MFEYVVGRIIKVNDGVFAALDLWGPAPEYQLTSIGAWVGQPGKAVPGYRTTSIRIIESLLEGLSRMGYPMQIPTWENAYKVLLILWGPKAICCAHGHLVKRTVDWFGIPVCESWIDEINEMENDLVSVPRSPEELP